MDIDSIKTLYTASSVARKFFDHMACRKRNQGETSVDRICELLSVDSGEVGRKEVVDLFQDLARLGCGQFVRGRKGYRSRLVWSVGSLQLAKIATGEMSAELIPDNDDSNCSDESDESETFMHAYILRESFSVSLELPSDLTRSEAERLAMFIRSLPMEE